MTKLTLMIVLALPFTGGCAYVTMQQLEGKLPKVEAKKASVEIQTIYGVSAQLTATNLKNRNGEKTADSYSYRIDSPLGHLKVETEGAKLKLDDSR